MKSVRTTKLINRKLLVFIIIALVIVWASWASYMRFVQGVGWANWTGFNARTLWDWMDLLVIPTALSILAWFFDRSAKSLEEKTAKQRADSNEAIARNNQRQVLLESYFDRMTELLLEKNLRSELNKPDSEVKCVARTRTLDVLRRLDGERKGNVVQFLYEAKLITMKSAMLDMATADLQGVQLVWARLAGINLVDTNLSGASLKWAHFERANLECAELVEANLQGAYLQNASLTSANLARSNLQKAHLANASLENTHLESADLTGADITNVCLTGARYNQYTKWPIGFVLSGTGVVEVDLN